MYFFWGGLHLPLGYVILASASSFALACYVIFLLFFFALTVQCRNVRRPLTRSASRAPSKSTIDPLYSFAAVFVFLVKYILFHVSTDRLDVLPHHHPPTHPTTSLGSDWHAI